MFPLLILFAAQPPVETKPQRVELTVKANPAPVPALKYELLPPLRDRTPGNAAVGYLRAGLLRPSHPRDPAEAAAFQKKIEGWEELKPEQLPREEYRTFLVRYREVLAEADAAARMDRCDWQQAGRLKADDLEGVISAVYAHREINRFLAYRAKLEVADDKPAAVIRTVQTGLRHAKDLGEGSTMIQMLVAVSNGTVTLAHLDSLIGLADAPNLYWALTALPHPLIDPRPSLEGETEFVTSFIPNLKELERGPVSEATAAKALDAAYKGLARVPDGGSDANGLDLLGSAVGRAAYLAAQSPGARKELVGRGWSKADADAMPAAQAVLLRAIARHRELWDDQVKLFHLPYPAAAAGMETVQNRVAGMVKLSPDDVLFRAMALLYPALPKVHFAHARLERRVAQLRALEAVRLHAATTNGSLPETLAEVKVPVPDDPLTGKPFGYKKDGPTFTLTAPAPTGFTTAPHTAHEYVVTVSK